MKVCHLCGDTYNEHVEFCFNDGEVLALADAAAAGPGALRVEADDAGEAPRVQGAQGAWTDGTPVPVPRSPNRQHTGPQGPAPAVAEVAAETTEDPAAAAPVPAENQPWATPAPSQETAPQETEPATAAGGQGLGGGSLDPGVNDDPPTVSLADFDAAGLLGLGLGSDVSDPVAEIPPMPVESSAPQAGANGEPGGLVVPPPSIKVTPAPVPASAGSQAATPILADTRARQAPVPVDVDLPPVVRTGETTKIRAVVPPTQARKTNPPNVRVVSAGDSDSSNLLWLGAMFAVGVLFALVGGSIPLLYMVYSGAWSGGGTVSGTTDPVRTETPQPTPDPEPVAEPVVTPPSPDVEPQAEPDVQPSQPDPDQIDSEPGKDAAPAPHPTSVAPSPKGAPENFRMRFRVSPPSGVHVDIAHEDAMVGTTLVNQPVGTMSTSDQTFDVPKPKGPIVFRFSHKGCDSQEETWTTTSGDHIEVTLTCGGPSQSTPSPAPGPVPTPGPSDFSPWNAPVPAVPAPAPAPPVRVMILVDGPTGNLFIDGKMVGATPFNGPLTPGVHQCDFGLAQTPDPGWSQKCTVVVGQPQIHLHRAH